MASTGAALFVLLVISSCAFSSAASIDGRPRPANFPDEPTVTYDGTPTLTDENGPVACIWYGFANMLYEEATTTSCLTVLRLALTNATVNPPANMKPYVYYTLKRLIDPNNNESYCYQGCFIDDTTAATPPLAAGEPTLAPFAPPPLTTEAPPPVSFGVPPSSSFSPAPSLFPGAPPPGMEDIPPLGAATPPASIFPPPGAAPELSTPPPELSTPAPVPAETPPPPTTASPVGSSGAFLQPAGLFSTLVAFAAILVAA